MLKIQSIEFLWKLFDVLKTVKNEVESIDMYRIDNGPVRTFDKKVNGTLAINLAGFSVHGDYDLVDQDRTFKNLHYRWYPLEPNKNNSDMDGVPSSTPPALAVDMLDNKVELHFIIHPGANFPRIDIISLVSTPKAVQEFTELLVGKGKILQGVS